jgi:hypothetical protein
MQQQEIGKKKEVQTFNTRCPEQVQGHRELLADTLMWWDAAKESSPDGRPGQRLTLTRRRWTLPLCPTASGPAPRSVRRTSSARPEKKKMRINELRVTNHLN